MLVIAKIDKVTQHADCTGGIKNAILGLKIHSKEQKHSLLWHVIYRLKAIYNHDFQQSWLIG